MQSETRDTVSSRYGVSLLVPLIGLFLGLCLALVARGEEPEPATGSGVEVDFSGTWELNEELSDDPREKVREAMGFRSGRGGGGRGGLGAGRGGGLGAGRGGGGGGLGAGRGGGGDGGRAGGPEGGGRGGGGQERGGGGEGGLEALKTLRVEHLDPQIVVLDANDRETQLYTDGRSFERRTRRGVRECTAEWKRNGRLKIETEDEERSQTEVWELVAEGKRLYITVEFEVGRGTEVEIRRVYDLVEVVEEVPQAE